jgi:hypothetical protein
VNSNSSGPLKIGFDMDGVLADFLSAFREVETQLFGPDTDLPAEQPEEEKERQERGLFETRQRRAAVWREIQGTEDFWATLNPLGSGSIRRLYELSLAHRWEVFFITQRPVTAGETVQRQTQRWLVEQGFDLPSVLVLSGPRAVAAAALRLSYHVDDNPQNCLEVQRSSNARPLLIVPDDDPLTVSNARKLGVGVASSLSACLDILEEASAAKSQPGVLERLAAIVGWR